MKLDQQQWTVFPILPRLNALLAFVTFALGVQKELLARLQRRPDGRLYLTAVELPAWQGIELPRQWDNPERLQDERTEVQLASFCEWVRESLQVWEESLRYLVDQ